MKIYFVVILSLFVSVGFAKSHSPPSIIMNDIQFERCDQFTFRYGFVIKVADIAWYAPECSSQSVLSAKTKILRFHYFKDVKADFFKDSAKEYFLLNLDNNTESSDLREDLITFNHGYSDIESGNHFKLVHLNDSTLSLYKNDTHLITTNNPVLADKYFNIWFGDQPVIEKLKKSFQ